MMLQVSSTTKKWWGMKRVFENHWFCFWVWGPNSLWTLKATTPPKLTACPWNSQVIPRRKGSFFNHQCSGATMSASITILRAIFWWWKELWGLNTLGLSYGPQVFKIVTGWSVGLCKVHFSNLPLKRWTTTPFFRRLSPDFLHVSSYKHPFFFSPAASNCQFFRWIFPQTYQRYMFQDLSGFWLGAWVGMVKINVCMHVYSIHIYIYYALLEAFHSGWL